MNKEISFIVTEEQ